MKKFLVGSGIIFFGIIFICMVYGEKVQHVKNQDLKVIQQKINSTPAYKPDINFGKIPLYFISNVGQVHKQAKFYAKASRYTLWLTKKGLVFDSTKKTEVKNKPLQRPNDSTFQRDVSRLMFLGSNKNPEMVPLNETKLKVNYFKGNDPSKWVGNIPTSQAVLYINLYKNIDLKVYGIEKLIEYDLIVKPGGNPENIRFEYKNIKKAHIDKEGNLVIKTKFGELIHKQPISYQENGELRGREDERARRGEVKAAFKKIGKNIYGFEVGHYDKSKELNIDPVILAYSTYLGGGNSDDARSITVDTSGHVYVTGATWSTDFPTLNQYQTNQAGTDAYVTKINPTLSGASGFIYSTYLGGAGNDYGNGIAVDSSGYTYVTGYTDSTNFPCLNQYQTDPGDGTYDAFVTKLDTSLSGTSSLLYSTYLGGGSTDYGYSLDVDNSGNAYVTGDTGSTNFPTLNQYQTDQTDLDAFVTKLDTTLSGASSLLYSTYLGGGSIDNGYGIAADSSGYAYVTGETASTDFPTSNQYQTDPGDSKRDAFVTKIDTTESGASSLIYSTYLGGGDYDVGYSIAVNSSGYAYVAGHTFSTNFPNLNGYQTDQSGRDVFVTKLDTTQSGTSSLLYSTYLGGGGDDQGYGIAVSSTGSAFVSGQTDSTDFPTLNQYQADQGGIDVFVTKLDTTQSGTSSLLYSTYLGGSAADKGRGIAADSSGNVYVAGNTESTNFPVLNQYQADQTGRDAFVTKLTTTPTIEVTCPDGGEYWPLNTSHNITWNAAGLLDTIYIILQQNGVNVALINKNINPALGTYTWAVGDCRLGTVVAGVNYKILLKVKNSTVKDKSDAAFTIPQLTVTSPNGGEDWQMSTAKNITWNAVGLTGTLYIILQQNGVNVALIQKNINPTLAAYTWTVGDCRIGTVVAGPNYKIVLKEKGTSIKDKSNNSFTISE